MQCTVHTVASVVVKNTKLQYESNISKMKTPMRKSFLDIEGSDGHPILVHSNQGAIKLNKTV